MNKQTEAPGQRLLFLLPFAPRLDATHGGARVMAQLLTALAKNHPLALVYFRGLDERALDRELELECDLVEEVPRPWTGRNRRHRVVRSIRLLASLAALRPLWVTDWASRVFAEQIRAVTRIWRPDIVQLEYHVMGQYLSVLDECPVPRVLVEYEPGLSAAPYLQTVGAFWNRPIHAVDRWAWRRYERTVLKQVQSIVVFTERDREALGEYSLNIPISLIPIGTVLPHEPLDPRGGSPLALVFVGNFVHPPNVDAAKRLVQSILPRVHEQYPEVALYLVGDNPTVELRQMESEQVTVTGRVTDIMPYLNRAAVFVAPLRQGGGMRVKILEALAAGKAVLTSPLAMEGIHGEMDGLVCLAETDEEFAARTIELLGNPERRAALAQRARAWAVANAAWDRSVQAYDALYDSLLRAEN